MKVVPETRRTQRYEKQKLTTSHLSPQTNYLSPQTNYLSPQTNYLSPQTLVKQMEHDIFQWTRDRYKYINPLLVN